VGGLFILEPSSPIGVVMVTTMWPADDWLDIAVASPPEAGGGVTVPRSQPDRHA